MVVKEKISPDQLGAFVKIVADIEREILSVGCELHIDCAEELLQNGSLSKNLWGANVYPQEKKINFVSLINIRPADGNRSMKIELPEVREKVEKIIHKLLF